jgi:hypothetical protein
VFRAGWQWPSGRYGLWGKELWAAVPTIAYRLEVDK